MTLYAIKPLSDMLVDEGSRLRVGAVVRVRRMALIALAGGVVDAAEADSGGAHSRLTRNGKRSMTGHGLQTAVSFSVSNKGRIAHHRLGRLVLWRATRLSAAFAGATGRTQR